MINDNDRLERIEMDKSLKELRELSIPEARRRVEALFAANGRLSDKHPRPIAGSSF